MWKRKLRHGVTQTLRVYKCRVETKIGTDLTNSFKCIMRKIMIRKKTTSVCKMIDKSVQFSSSVKLC